MTHRKCNTQILSYCTIINRVSKGPFHKSGDLKHPSPTLKTVGMNETVGYFRNRNKVLGNAKEKEKRNRSFIQRDFSLAQDSSLAFQHLVMRLIDLQWLIA